MLTIRNAAILGLTILAIVIGIDIYLAADTIKGNTWSEMVRAFSFKSPFAPWAWGGLGGHFFHQWIPKFPLAHDANIALLVWLSALVMVVGHSLYMKGTYLPPFAVLFVSTFIWSTLWPV